MKKIILHSFILLSLITTADAKTKGYGIQCRSSTSILDYYFEIIDFHEPYNDFVWTGLLDDTTNQVAVKIPATYEQIHACAYNGKTESVIVGGKLGLGDGDSIFKRNTAGDPELIFRCFCQMNLKTLSSCSLQTQSFGEWESIATCSNGQFKSLKNNQNKEEN